MVQKSQTTTWDGAKTLVNTGISYQPQLVTAGFLPVGLPTASIQIKAPKGTRCSSAKLQMEKTFTHNLQNQAFTAMILFGFWLEMWIFDIFASLVSFIIQVLVYNVYV